MATPRGRLPGQAVQQGWRGERQGTSPARRSLIPNAFGTRRRGERRRCLWAPSLVADQEEQGESHTGVYFYNQAVMPRGHGGVKSCKTSRGFGEALELSWWLS